MNDTTYKILTDNNVDVDSGSEKYGGNADLYMIFLKNYFQENDILDMKRCLESGDVSKSMFYASAFLSASRELYVTEITELVEKIKSFLDENLINEAKSIMALLEPKYSKLSNIVMQSC